MPGQPGSARTSRARRPAAPRPAARPPGGQAPGYLAILQAFINTRDIEQATDELASPQQLAAWLHGAGLLTPPHPAAPAVRVTGADLATARQLREALRAVLASHVTADLDQPGTSGGGQPSASEQRQPGASGGGQPGMTGQREAMTADLGESGTAVTRDLNRIAVRLPTRLMAGADGRPRVIADGTGVTAGLARLLLIAVAAGADGTWDRLKVCRADDCRWAFYDRSPTRSGTWCSMRICGSRAKSRAYRQRAGPEEPGSGRHAEQSSHAGPTEQGA